MGCCFRVMGGIDRMDRREFLQGLVLGALAAASPALTKPASAQTQAPTPPPPARVPFSRAALLDEARKLAQAPFVEPTLDLPARFADLSYEQYREIRWKRDLLIWRAEGRGFGLEPLHTGSVYRAPVQLYIVEDGQTARLAFDRDKFDYGPNVKPPEDPKQDLSFSGFKLRRPLRDDDKWNEFAIFQGATYFKALARGLTYGLTARGLAINTADPDGEEFPVFTRFYVERPDQNAASVIVHALLDSRSVTGAYRFTLRPGEETTIDVELTLFPRAELGHIGLGALNSMFLYDSTNRTRFDDLRPAVHMSDGLAITTGSGERIWRPLGNPRNLQISAFVDQSPRGFALAQRRRAFPEFQDLENRYDLKPSAWIEPVGDWGQGSVVLVEIPSDAEIHENIVAYWRPKAKLPAGQEFSAAYRLHWGPSMPTAPEIGFVSATREGQGTNQTSRRFVVDFLGNMPAAGAVKLEISASAGRILNPILRPNPVAGGYRVQFDLDTRNVPLSELRLLLTDGAKPVSETWLYRWTP